MLRLNKEADASGDAAHPEHQRGQVRLRKCAADGPGAATDLVCNADTQPEREEYEDGKVDKRQQQGVCAVRGRTDRSREDYAERPRSDQRAHVRNHRQSGTRAQMPRRRGGRAQVAGSRAVLH